ncbi:MAG: glycosyltransferase [Lentisphaeria bacterium]|nr:glycosyltransferase [Lentisphaeria bacterium]NQZ66885.1 glycosyltransferase [Lentisphaeria bacterium]
MKSPQVTIIVTQRERFSFTQESLESIYEHTKSPFKLIYVDGNSPTHIRRYLESQAGKKGYSLVRNNHYLFPNKARNIGLSKVDTKYAIFIDNDVVVSSGWLAPLLKCAEETGATVLSPLICIGKPLHESLHNGGGSIHITEEKSGEKLIRHFSNKDEHGGSKYEGKLSQLRGQIHRGNWDYVEFHCMMVRTEIFKSTGLLDEGLMSTREHIDFCMTVTQFGGTIYMEPNSIVTYIPGPPEKSDMLFFMLRWSDKRHYASMKRFKTKWELDEVKYKKPGFRRERAYIAPLVEKIPLIRSKKKLKKKSTKILVSLDRLINRFLSFCYDKEQKQ